MEPENDGFERNLISQDLIFKWTMLNLRGGDPQPLPGHGVFPPFYTKKSNESRLSVGGAGPRISDLPPVIRVLRHGFVVFGKAKSVQQFDVSYYMTYHWYIIDFIRF